MTTTWTIEVDWERNGSFVDTYDNITDRVQKTNWFLGMSKPFQNSADNSKLNLTLTNTDRRYSPENTSSPLAGSLLPFRPVRVRSSDDTGVTVAGTLIVPKGNGTDDGPAGGFIADGTYNGEAAYTSVKLAGDGGGSKVYWYLWYDSSASRYRLTASKGSASGARWLGPSGGDVAGSYTAEGGVSGAAATPPKAACRARPR